MLATAHRAFRVDAFPSYTAWMIERRSMILEIAWRTRGSLVGGRSVRMTTDPPPPVPLSMSSTTKSGFDCLRLFASATDGSPEVSPSHGS